MLKARDNSTDYVGISSSLNAVETIAHSRSEGWNFSIRHSFPRELSLRGVVEKERWR